MPFLGFELQNAHFLIQEIALLQHTLRSASVESFTQMEVLVISKEDFQRIFFNAKDGGEPDHIVFCRWVEIWSIHFIISPCAEIIYLLFIYLFEHIYTGYTYSDGICKQMLLFYNMVLSSKSKNSVNSKITVMNHITIKSRYIHIKWDKTRVTTNNNRGNLTIKRKK